MNKEPNRINFQGRFTDLGNTNIQMNFDINEGHYESRWLRIFSKKKKLIDISLRFCFLNNKYHIINSTGEIIKQEFEPELAKMIKDEIGKLFN